jgi:hypothetical protein
MEATDTSRRMDEVVAEIVPNTQPLQLEHLQPLPNSARIEPQTIQ